VSRSRRRRGGPHDPGRAAALFVDWQSRSDDGGELVDPSRSQYKEFFLVVNATMNGEAVTTCPFIWVDRDFALARGEALRGTLRLDEGPAPEGTLVTAALECGRAPHASLGAGLGSLCWQDGAFEWSHPTTVSGPDGRFELSGLAPRRYALRAQGLGIDGHHLRTVYAGSYEAPAGELALGPLLAQVDLPAIAEPEPEDPTAALLDDLAGRRGVRQETDLDADADEFPGFGPQHAFDFENPDLGIAPVPAAHPPASHPEEAVDARVLQMSGGRGGRAAQGAQPTGCRFVPQPTHGIGPAVRQAVSCCWIHAGLVPRSGWIPPCSSQV